MCMEKIKPMTLAQAITIGSLNNQREHRVDEILCRRDDKAWEVHPPLHQIMLPFGMRDAAAAGPAS